MRPEEREGVPEAAEPDLPGKVVQLHAALAEAGIPHAFGGAIAVGYYREPRTTIDIDVQVFLQPPEREKVLERLENLFPLADRASLDASIRDHEQGQAKWGGTKIDLFFSFMDFHEAVRDRVRNVEYERTEIPILSAEDIIIFKVLYGRTQDWADIEAVFELGGAEMDMDYLAAWIRKLVGDEESIARLEGLADQIRDVKDSGQDSAD